MDNKTEIVNQGVDFIFDHLFEKIRVEEIADHCCFSRHYFNRLFKSVTGESIYGFVRRLRLERAAFELIKFPHLSITDVAAEQGYSSSNFSVLFKGHYGLSPSRFRSDPGLSLDPEARPVLERIRDLQQNRPETLLSQMDRQISIQTIPDFRLVYQRFKGNYQDLPRAWATFCEEMEHFSFGSPIEFYGISYDDPLIVGSHRCLYDLCTRITGSARAWGKNHRKIKGGTYLCYRFDGRADELKRLYNDLFAVWIPHRGHIIAPGPCFERYYPATGPGGRLLMDLCIPVLT
ncbi:MAG: helix-turn-helix domain-containing protein [Desulfobacteraceae bacterium]|nr:helix-turn-helix domain-containing protein [Desulfobacteraceae bacterium]